MKRLAIGFVIGLVLGAGSALLAVRYIHREEATTSQPLVAWFNELDPRYKAYIQAAPNGDAQATRIFVVAFCRSVREPVDDCLKMQGWKDDGRKGQALLRGSEPGQH